MDRDGFDIVSVTQIVALRLLVDIVQNDSCCDKINNFTGWQLIQVRTAVFSSVSIHLKKRIDIGGKKKNCVSCVLNKY